MWRRLACALATPGFRCAVVVAIAATVLLLAYLAARRTPRPARVDWTAAPALPRTPIREGERQRAVR